MKKYLIAEIGNNHLGDFEKAKEMIRVAKESGANLVKLQAIDEDCTGSMPRAFYKKVSMSTEYYIDLIEYGRDIGIDVFYSIFSKKHDRLKSFLYWKKLAAGQFASSFLMNPKKWDKEEVFLSINSLTIDRFNPVKIKNAKIMFATPYCEPSPDLPMRAVQKFTGRFDIGLSDHSIGVQTCMKCISMLKVPLIEKHFVLEEDKNNIKFKGKLFRDSVHAATPSEMEQIAKEFFK